MDHRGGARWGETYIPMDRVRTPAAKNVSGPMNKLSRAFFRGFAFHHYYLDSKIWRASEDAELRSILGFPGKKKRVAPAEPERTDRVANVHREATG